MSMIDEVVSHYPAGLAGFNAKNRVAYPASTGKFVQGPNFGKNQQLCWP